MAVAADAASILDYGRCHCEAHFVLCCDNLAEQPKAADSVAGLHRKLPIESIKLPIDLEKLPIQAPTKSLVKLLYSKFGTDIPFGTAQVIETVGLKERASRNLLALMRKHHLVSAVKGRGKGKVCFCNWNVHFQ